MSGLKIEGPLKSVSVPCPNCGSSNWWPAQPSDTAVSAVRLDALEAKVEKLLKAQDDRVGKFPEEAYGEPQVGSLAHHQLVQDLRHLDRMTRAALLWDLRGAELPPKRHARSGYAPPSFNPIKWWGRDKPGYSPGWIAFDEAATISDKSWIRLANDALKQAIASGQPNWDFAASDAFKTSDFWPFEKPKKKRVAKPRRQSKTELKRKK